MRRQKQLALLCLLGFALALVYAVGNYPQQRKIAINDKSRGQQMTQEKMRNSAPLPVVASTTAVSKYPGFRADLFRPLFERPPVVRQPRPKKTLVKRKARPLPPPPPPPVQPPSPLVASRLASFTYLGQAREGGRRSIFLKEKELLFVVKVGEDFGKDKEFRLVQVTDREIRIETGEPVETIRIPLQKKQPLQMRTAVRSSARSPLGS